MNNNTNEQIKILQEFMSCYKLQYNRESCFTNAKNKIKKLTNTSSSQPQQAKQTDCRREHKSKKKEKQHYGRKKNLRLRDLVYIYRMNPFVPPRPCVHLWLV